MSHAVAARRRADEESDEGGDDGAGRAVRHLAGSVVPGPVVAPDDVAERGRYERSPVSVLWLIVSTLAVLVVEGLAWWLPSASRGTELDLQRHAGSWASGLGGLAQAVASSAAVVVLVGAAAVVVAARRWRHLATTCVAAALAAAGVVMAARATGATPGSVSSEEAQLALVAAATAVGAMTFPLFSPRVRRWSMATMVAGTLLAVLGGGVSLPSRMVVLLWGEAAGSAVALLAGLPSRRIQRSELEGALERSRLQVTRLERLSLDARGSQPWAATSATGRELFVKVAAVDELRADQLFRLWERVRVRRPGDRASAPTILQAAEHEAFLAERARSAGVLTPAVVDLGVIGQDRGVFTAFEALEATTLGELEGIDPAVLRAAWSQIQVLRRNGIAHRDLRAANVMSDGERVWIIDFGAAVAPADDELLERDVAEFLASSAALVGVERAVDAAVAVLGADTVATGIPWIQPMAVTTATRASLRRADFERLRDRVREASGEPAPELPQLQRVTWKGIAVFVALAVAVWTLLPQLTSGVDWSTTLEAHPGWAALAVAASAATYLGAALSLAGAVIDHVPLGRTFMAQLASSFANRITPGKVGGPALNLRFLVKQGVDRAVAASGIGVSTLMGTVVHVAITVVVVVWAGNTGMSVLSLPPGWVLLAVAGGPAVAATVVAAVPPVRSWWGRSVLPGLRRSWRSTSRVLRSPTNLAQVVGGSATVTLANLVAFVVSLRAFGVGAGFATLAVVYLAGAAVASAAPTPGGLGATEAALVAGLLVAGVGRSEAIPGVLLFRVATFWLPILPGWIGITVLQRRGDL